MDFCYNRAVDDPLGVLVMVSTARNAVHLERDDDFAGRYRVIRELASGGMASVYEVVDTTTDRLRALKLMLPELARDPDLRARFLDEASVVGRVRSDHIVEVVDAGIDDETPYLVMELLVGEDLGHKLEEAEAGLEPDFVLTALQQLALGLDKVHEEGVVHRDLKPENIFATVRDDGSPCIKILDFGIAKVVSHLATLSTTRSLGTPLYMSPEQLRGEGTVDPTSDLYALGHVAFTLLVGKPYWYDEARKATSVYAFVNRVLDGTVEPASKRAKRFSGALPSSFDAWFSRATHPDPAARYPTAAEQVQALAEALAGREVAAAPMTAVPQKAPGSRAGWPFAAIVAIALVAGAAVVWGLREDEVPATVPTIPSTDPASDTSASAPRPTPPTTASHRTEPTPVSSTPDVQPRPVPAPLPAATSPVPAPAAYDPLDEL